MAGKQLYHVFPGKFKHSKGIVGLVERIEVKLTPAQVKALFTTPVTLIPAPGANRYIQVMSVAAKLQFVTTAYTGANAVEVRYTNASGAKVTGDLAAAWLNSATSRVDIAVDAAVTSVVNSPVVAAVPTANPGAGDGLVVLDIVYRIIKLTT